MRRIRIEWVERASGITSLYGHDGGSTYDGVVRMTFYLHRDNIHDPSVRADLAREIQRWVRGPMWQREQSEIADERVRPSWYYI